MPANCGRKQSDAPVSEIDAVLDTDVLIEIFRGDDRARAWLARIESHVLGIPVFVYMEILHKREQRALVAQLTPYTILHLESGDSPKAQQWFEQFHLSYGIGIMDCLIATSPFRLGCPFFTFNLKHFRVLPGLVSVHLTDGQDSLPLRGTARSHQATSWALIPVLI